MKVKFFSIIIAIIAIAIACKNEKEQNEIKISKNGGTESHNMGQNCLSCHVSGGRGEGIFTMAGTVYDSSLTVTYANGKIELYSQPQGAGTLLKTIDIDAKGNFYTTENISFSGSVYPVAVNVLGKKKFMGSNISTGACNSCHGVSQSKIYVGN